MASPRRRVKLLATAVLGVAAMVLVSSGGTRSGPATPWMWSGHSAHGPHFAVRPDLAPGGFTWGDSENTYSRSQVTTNEAGQLIITAHRAHGSWVSGQVTTKGHTQFTYGYVAARIKTPVGQGLWPAFWMLGVHNQWPGNGPEIDVMEDINDGRLYGSLHTWGRGARPASLFQAVHVAPSGSDGRFHTYAVNWVPGKVEWFRDGVKYGQSSRARAPAGKWSFDQPHYLILDLAVGGAWPGHSSAATPSTAAMTIDWVKISASKPAL